MRYWETLTAVERRIEAFPPAVHTDDPRMLLSRLLALGDGGTRNYEAAVTRAALMVLLAAAIDQAEEVRVDTGIEAA